MNLPVNSFGIQYVILNYGRL